MIQAIKRAIIAWRVRRIIKRVGPAFNLNTMSTYRRVQPSPAHGYVPSSNHEGYWEESDATYRKRISKQR